MAEFEVKVKGDARGIFNWSIHLSSGNDSPDLNTDKQHSSAVINAVFNALASYDDKKKDEQNIPLSSGSSPNPN